MNRKKISNFIYMNNNSDITVSSIVILICASVLFYMYKNEEFTNSYESVDSNTKIIKIDENACSKQCCNHVQWPVPFNTKNPNLNSSQEKDFIPSNLSCNGGQGGGCVCLSKNQFNYLSNHGQ